MPLRSAVNWPEAKATTKPTIRAATTAGHFLMMRGTRKKASTAAPHTRGLPTVVVTIPEPNFIIAPATIAITISRGRNFIILPMAPVRPIINTMTPAMIKAKAASLKV